MIPTVPNWAVTRVTVDTILACSTVLTCVINAIVDVCRKSKLKTINNELVHDERDERTIEPMGRQKKKTERKKIGLKHGWIGE